MLTKVLLGAIVLLLLALGFAGWRLEGARRDLKAANDALQTAQQANSQYAEALKRVNDAHAAEIADREKRLSESKKALAAIEQRKVRPIIKVIQAAQSSPGAECETSRKVFDTFLRDSAQ